MNKKVTVAIVKCPDYNQPTVDEAVRQAVMLAELDGEFIEGKSILLKPNLLSARDPEEAVTTHPAVISALARLASSNGCKIRLGDSPPFAGQSESRYEKLLYKTGTTEIAARFSAEVIRFEQETITIQNPEGKFYKSFEIARAVSDADVIVNIPKLKTHSLTIVTGAVKNVFGVVPGVRKGLFHAQAGKDRTTFSEMLVDLYQAVCPSVNVMDAVVAMEGEGPNSGKPKQMGLILASADAVALDAVACAIIGLQPMEVDMVRVAAQRGLGVGDISEIEVRGEALDSIKVENFLFSTGKDAWLGVPYPIRTMLRRQLVAHPRVREDECSGCEDCVKVCPVDAIAPGKPVSIDLNKCIRCYCCAEVCNYAAMELKQGWLARILQRLYQKR